MSASSRTHAPTAPSTAPLPSLPDGTGLPADHPLVDGRTAGSPLVDA